MEEELPRIKRRKGSGRGSVEGEVSDSCTPIDHFRVGWNNEILEGRFDALGMT